MTARTPSIAFSLTMLPTEVLEQILDEIFPTGERRPKVTCDSETLLVMMKTCRKMYALGSVRLYHAPLDLRSDTFDELARTLRDNGSLAQCVQDLNRLSSTVESYQYDVPMGSSELQRERKWKQGLDLQLDVLRACTNVGAVSILLHAQSATAEIAACLAENRQLRYLALAFDFSPTISLQRRGGSKDLGIFKVLLKELAEAASSSAEGPRLRRVEIAPEGHSCLASFGLGPILRALTAHVNLEITQMPKLATLRCCSDGAFGGGDSGGQPVRSPVELSIIEWDQKRDPVSSEAAYRELLTLLRGNRLVSFSYIEEAIAVSLQLRDYVKLAAPAVPSLTAFFALFPAIRYLCLADLKMMSLDRLDTLASASPNLVTLKLRNALWNIQPNDLASASARELSPFEVRVCGTLEKLEHLEEVDLGIWPYRERLRRGSDLLDRIGLRARLAKRNVKLTVHGCC